jgi:hypothetical protein
MSRGKKVISERADARLEEKGYLMSVRAEMKAEVMKCLVEMEEAGQISSDLRIKRYTPPDEENKQALGHVLEFLRFHGMTNTAECLVREVNANIDLPGNSEGDVSLIAQSIREKAPDVDEGF